MNYVVNKNIKLSSKLYVYYDITNDNIFIIEDTRHYRLFLRIFWRREDKYISLGEL